MLLSIIPQSMDGHFEIGDVVMEKWHLKRRLGEGSYGRVFEAEREDFGTSFTSAIKIITIPPNKSEVDRVRAEGMDDESVTSYFRRLVEEMVHEFELMSKLKMSANVIRYEDHEVVPHSEGVGWDIFIRMELLTPMLQYLKDHTLDQRAVAKLGVDICKALEMCQKQNIIHRDIKPENIMISETGDFKLGDFGVARIVDKTTGGLSQKGTYTYMAPEIFHGQPYGSSVDTYSLGIVLYSLLNDNRAPFLPALPAPITHSDRENALGRRMRGDALPIPRTADEGLSQIVLKACAFQPKDRYENASRMREELEAYLRGELKCEPVAAQGESPSDLQEPEDLEATVGIYENQDQNAGFAPQEESAAMTEREESEQTIPYEPSAEELVKDAAPAKKSGKLPVVIGSAAAILVVAAIVLLIALGGGKKGDKSGDGGQTDLASEPVKIETLPNEDSNTGKDQNAVEDQNTAADQNAAEDKDTAKDQITGTNTGAGQTSDYVMYDTMLDVVPEPGTPVQTLDPQEIYASMTYRPEMFYGGYRILGTKEEVKACCQKMDSFEYPVYDAINKIYTTRDLCVIPYAIEAGPKSGHFGVVENIVNLDGRNTDDFMQVSFYDKYTGHVLHVTCYYEVEGRTLKLWPVEEYEYVNGVMRSYRISDTFWEYQFAFKGTALTLTSGGFSAEMKAGYTDGTEENASIYVLGYADPQLPNIADIIGFDFRWVGEQGKNHFYTKYVNRDGKETTAKEDIGIMSEDGLFTFRRTYNEGARKADTYQFVYFYCGWDGLILTDGENLYWYHLSMSEYSAAKTAE